eukprot:TRINITY_DN9688_c0_g1_i1.p1 TRINITY_DN9688_c0_g1~~TRINITY_DN9688_c0_g1_i1.p1  ORF type:complete len:612 (-),score=107.26 TRINITY_DN9688_c0_g1_i1:387-2222(-)
MVRSMLSRSGLSKSFWPEAVLWSSHLLNRSPTIAVRNKTPEEAWSGRRPSIDHLRIFGCIAYAHVPDEKRKKLDDRGVKCVFLGVSAESKAYRLYNPVTKQIIISRDVVFDEENVWDWNDKETQQIPENFDNEEQQQLQIPVFSSLSTSAPIREHTPNACSPPVQRHRKRPAWMMDYVSGDELSDDGNSAHFVLFADYDPVTFQDVVQDTKWKKAMDAEIHSIEKNDTWELTDLPQGHKTIGVKWVYKTKLNEKGEVDKHKARLVAKGYKQEYGVDYTEVFAPVARLDTIRAVLSMAAENSWPTFQLDVKSAFLHGELNEHVYVDQPPGYVRQGQERKVYKLKKALYGLKQAPRAWYSCIDAYLAREGFKKCPYEPTLYIKLGEGGKILIICLYVDDLIYTGNDKSMFDVFKQSMMTEFDMTDLGLMRYFLGIEVVQGAAGNFLYQKKYMLEILDKFEMKGCNSVGTPSSQDLMLTQKCSGKKVDATLYKQIVGSLMYLTATRPDIMHAVSLVSRYMESPTEVHLHAAKRILRYLSGTIDYGLFYKRGVKSGLFGFSDSDYAGDPNDPKSTSGYVFLMGSAAVSWSSKKQPIVTLSTTEAEFVAALVKLFG